MQPRLIDRRAFLSGSCAALALAACGGGSSAQRLGVRFPDGIRAPTVAVSGAGPQRFPFVVISDDGLPAVADAPESIDVEILFGEERVGEFVLPRRGTGQFTPYYPLVFTPTAAGRYVARPSFSDIGQEFVVAERSEVELFQVGDQLPPFDTPTFDDGRGVEPVCTRAEPCPFHELTLSEAVANGRPTALLISTPEFCQTDVCGPSLEFFIAAAEGRSDVDFVHAEVFADPRSADPGSFPEIAPLLIEWQLDFEPSLFVADESGTIVATRHFAFDLDETFEAIDTL